jgi:hypothetical protein
MWEKKLGGLLNSQFRGNASTKFGQQHEKIAIEKFVNDSSGKYFACGLLVHVNLPYLGYSPDGFYEYEVNGEKRLSLLEIKCPAKGGVMSFSEMVHNLTYLKVDEHGCISLKKKHPYYGQVQLGLYITNLSKCFFIVYNRIDDAYVVLTILPDLEFQRKLVTALKDVYFNNYLPYLVKCKF